MLRPGFFARARIVAQVLKDAVVVPQRAVSEVQGSLSTRQSSARTGKRRSVPSKSATAPGTDWVITSGLKPGEKVVVEGLQKIKAGAPVAAKPWTPPAGEDRSRPVEAKTRAAEASNAMAKFFINRPIVAIVISIVMTIVGIITYLRLPVAQFPDIVPPEIQVKTTYTGADALTVEQSVATPIEQQMSGVDNMNYMQSVNGNDGTLKLTVNFEVGTDVNTDQILSQMRSNQASSQLPQDVNKFGVTVQKSTSSPLIMFALYSPKGTYDNVFLANYANINLNDEFTRVKGIASVHGFRRRPIRDAHLGEARPAGQARPHDPGNH